MSVGRSTGRQTCVRAAEIDSQTHNVPCEYPHNACPILCVVLCGQSISSESYLFTLSRKLPLCGVPIHDRGCDSSASGHGRAYPIVLSICSLFYHYRLHIHHPDTMLITPAILALPLLASAVPTAKEQLAFQGSIGSAILEGQDIFAAHDGFSLDLGEMRLVQFSEEEPPV